MRKIEWVFGYGSLIWDPGFSPVETARAWVSGYARSFCLRSIQHRGTATLPGLVLGLDEQSGGECSGLALRIANRDHDEVLAYLRARELVTDAYKESILPLRLEDGRRVEALAYVMRRDHVQYAGGLELAEQARIIAQAQGRRGPNADYLFNTAAHLSQIGLADAVLDQLTAEVRKLLESDTNPPA
ncbi:gamma-glutamylcyclotransferase [Paracoccus benzoatiresistens]|uniref:glutathione-specific gamma-glutamylcyclotransferase n=1 Tax=Paracoccus benzoatiresistens TaxID=2997341 RepID=A0ABT4J7P0_9RHOB|nr:gamma-glutamylcyclotransferase [Paracoccus sp. EF6]MCZ0962592.1 gamma-glutamylcyclotransferase [Paracoccus sp. EF6]